MTARGEEHAFLHKSKFKIQTSYGGQKRVDGPRAVQNVKIHFLKTLPTNKYDEGRITKIKLNKSRHVRFFVACFCFYPSVHVCICLFDYESHQGETDTSSLYLFYYYLHFISRAEEDQTHTQTQTTKAKKIPPSRTKKRGKKTGAVSAVAAAESAPAAAVQIATKQKPTN